MHPARRRCDRCAKGKPDDHVHVGADVHHIQTVSYEPVKAKRMKGGGDSNSRVIFGALVWSGTIVV